MVSKNVVNIGSGNGLLPQGTRPLPEPMLTYHQWDPVSFTWVQFHRKCSGYVSLIWVWKWLNTAASVKGQSVKYHHMLKCKDDHWLLDHHWRHWRLLMTAFQVLILIKLLSLVANRVVNLTTSAAANDKNFVIMRTFAFKITTTSPRNNDLSK